MQQENEGFPARRGTIKQQMKGGIEVVTTENTVDNSNNNSHVEMESVRAQDHNQTGSKSIEMCTERVMYNSEQKKPTRYQDLENNYSTSPPGMQGRQFPQKTSADNSAPKKDDIIKYCAFVMFCIIFVIFLVQSFQAQDSRQYIIPSHQYIQDESESTPGHTEDQLDDFVFEGDLGVFVQSMQTFPHEEIFSKFQMGDNADKLKQEWVNDVYGGSVLDPIVEISISNDGHKKAENVPNYLRAHLQNLRSGWHYFNLKNIFIKRKRFHSFFADVELIVTDPLKKEDYDMLREMEGRFKGTYSEDRSNYLKDNTNLEEFAVMDEIEPFLSGYGRIIFYDVSGYETSNSDGTKVYDPFVNPELNKITQIKEGQFFEGKAEGYCRIMDPSRRVQVGFFKEDWPYGKLKEFVDGELTEQGIYDEVFNDDDESSFLKAVDIKSFEENVDPMDFEDVSAN